MEHSENFRTDVRALYEELPFPLRDPEDEDWRLVTPPPDVLARINHFCFGGRQDFGDGFRALVAGGGTGDAAIFLAAQLAARGGRVTYLDMSTGSMAVAQARAQRRGLTNIDWVHASILDLPKLGLGTFDYINCVGVIHHLEDPEVGFRCLETALGPQGGMALMVYGKYGRMHISVIQDLTRLLFADTPQTADKVGMTKELFLSLPPTNLFLRGRNREQALSRYWEDAPNLADTFLHPCDQPFSTSQLQDMIERSGLHLAAFTSFEGRPAITRLQYEAKLFVKAPALVAKLDSLPLREQRQIAEIIDGNLWLHTVYVTRGQNSIASFGDTDNIPFVPTSYADFALSLLRRRPEKTLDLELANNSSIPIRLSPSTCRFLAAMDGRRNMREILEATSLDAVEAEAVSNDLSLLNSLDWILVRHSSVRPFPLIGDPVSFDESRFGDGSWALPYQHPTIQARSL